MPGAMAIPKQPANQLSMISILQFDINSYIVFIYNKIVLILFQIKDWRNLIDFINYKFSLSAFFYQILSLRIIILLITHQMKGIQFTIEKTSSQIESILIKSTIKLTPDIFQISFGKFCMQVLYIAETIIKNCDLQKHVPVLFQKLIGKLKQSRKYKPNCQQQQEPMPIQNDEIYQFMNTRRPIQEPKNIAELNWYAERMLKKQKDTTTFMEYMATAKGPNYSDRQIIKKESKCVQTDIVWIKNLIAQQEKVLENLMDSIPQFVQKVNSYEQKCKNLQRQIQIQNQKYKQDIDEIKKEGLQRKQEKQEEIEETKKENKSKNGNGNGNGNRNNIKTKSLTTSKRTTFYKQKQIQRGRQKQKHKQNQNKDKDKQIENLNDKIMQNDYAVDLNEQQPEKDQKQRVNDLQFFSQTRQQSRNILSDENQNKINFLYFNKEQEEKGEGELRGQKMGKIGSGSRKENVEQQKENKGRYSMDENQMKGMEARRQSCLKNRVQRKEKKNKATLNQSVKRKSIENQTQKNYQKLIEQQIKKNNSSSSYIYPNLNQDRSNQCSNLKNITQFFVNENQMRDNHNYDTKDKLSNVIFQDSTENQLEQKETNRQIILLNLQKNKKWMNNNSNLSGHSLYEQKINMKAVSNKFATKIKTLLPNIGNECYEVGKENLPNIHMSKQSKMINQKQDEGLLSKQDQKMQMRFSSHHERSQKQFLQTIEKGKIIQEEDLMQKDMKIIEKINELQRNQKGNNKKIKAYVEMLQKLHRRFCGKQCKHLQRYYKQIKTAHNWNNRIALNLPTRQIGFFS